MDPVHETPAATASTATTATVLFTDVVGSTDLLDRLGEAAWAVVALEHLGRLRAVLAEHGGREVKSMGDGLMVAFARPTDAAACALAMQEAVARPGAGGVVLGLRVGLTSGEVLVEGDDLYGRTVVVASRLCAQAEAGEVLAAGHLAALVGPRDDLVFDPVGLLRLKGIEQPQPTVAIRPRAPGPPTRTTPTSRFPLPAIVRQIAARPLLGRAAPLRRLTDHLRRAGPGHRRLLLLAGEPGIGKTRLAAELAVRAHEGGAVVMFGRCEEEASLPFQPWVSALDPFAGALEPGLLRRRLGPREHDLARMLPNLRRADGGRPGGAADDPETDRYRLFEGVVALLELAAERGPVVLVLDDLQWADGETLGLMRHVMHAPRAFGLLVVGTYRDAEVHGEHPLALVMADLRREGLWERVRLSGLDVQDVKAIAEAQTGSTVLPSVAQALWEATEGHPFFVGELIRHLMENEGLGNRRGAFLLRRGALAGGIPEGVRDVVAERLRRLPPATGELLRTAAVVGLEFGLDTLGAVTGASDDAIAEGLEPALVGQVVEPAGETLDRFVFSHGLVREALYEALAPRARAALHGRVGAALAQVPPAARADGHQTELAHHFLAAARSGEGRELAVVHAVAAAEQARQDLAFEKAAQLYASAIALLDGPQDGPDRCELALALGEMQWSTGAYKESRTTLAAAAELAERHGLGTTMAQAALAFGGRLGFQASAPDDELLDLLERALVLLGDAPSAMRTRVTSRLALALTHQGQPGRQRELGERAIAEATSADDPVLLAEVLGYSGWALWGPDNLEERLRIADQLVALADTTGPQHLRIEGRNWRAAHRMEAGDMAGADDDFARMTALAEESSQPFHLWEASVARTVRALGRAIDEEAFETIWATIRGGEGGENYAAMQIFSGHCLHAFGLAGRTVEFASSARDMTEYFDTIKLFQVGLAATYCQLERLDDARERFEVLAQDDFATIPRDWMWLSAATLLGEVCWKLGDAPRARVLHGLLAPYAEHNVVLGAWSAPLGLAARSVGLAAECAGWTDEAVRRLEQAVAGNERLGLGPMALVARVDLARVLTRRGAGDDHARARELVRAAGPAVVAQGLRALWPAVRALERSLGLPAVVPDVITPNRGLLDRASAMTDAARAAVSSAGRGVLGRRLADVPDEVLARRFGHPIAQRALFAGMARSFQPRASLDFQGEMGFVLYDDAAEDPGAPQWWTLKVAGGRAVARHRPAKDPAMVVHVQVPALVRMISGEVNPIALWVQQEVWVEGDMLLAPRLVDMFGGVRLAEALVGVG